MELQFKHQKFQADAARAIVDVFVGQPYMTSAYEENKGCGFRTGNPEREGAGIIWPNAPIVPKLADGVILDHIRQIQKKNRIALSPRLEGRYNLTVEMETGSGKTYTYIKTMYELNKQYGWSKFIIVVPSIAIREGACRFLQMTQDHFAEEYGKKIRFFIYHSSRLREVYHFASDSGMNVMIINSQAFNAKGQEARRIFMRLDEFGSRRPIDLIAKTNPVVIIDEPQSVEGERTKERLRQFHPLMTLRYSATHKPDSIYNMVYRLDAAKAYHKGLVKKIAVKGITESKTAETGSYVYLEGIHLSKAAPTAAIWFDCKTASGIRKKSQKAGIGFDLYRQSGGLAGYKEGFVVKNIDGRDDSVEFANGIKIYAGDIAGRADEGLLRRIQIRETILSHIDRERQLFPMGIKVLSLFFIDEVAHYKVYDFLGRPGNGVFARMFEEEYQDVIDGLRHEEGNGDYVEYLDAIPASGTHAGYFSIDKKGRIVNRAEGDDKRGGISNDCDAYDLIMKNKELLLELDPKKSPVRFIFSHSALREGWDNPNVFQICTLKNSDSSVRKRQEVGRGLRLCVNREGERMDADILGSDVHKVNVLTVIASESYDSFAKGLQKEIAGQAMGASRLMTENARSRNVELKVDKRKLNSREFKDLWSKMNAKSVYTVDFDDNELAGKCIEALNRKLDVPKASFQVESGQMGDVGREGDMFSGLSMIKGSSSHYEGRGRTAWDPGIKYDLAGGIVKETGLTRRTVTQVLMGIGQTVFDRFKDNPEEFIRRAALLINEQKAAAMMGNITYKPLEERYGTDVFTEQAMKGRIGKDAMEAEKHLYDYVIYDSKKEREFAGKLDMAEEVAVYVKLPDGFSIPTPAGRYTPGWAIAFYEGRLKHRCLIADIGNPSGSARRRMEEKAKFHCAKEHFRAVGNGQIVYETADSYEALMKKIMK